MLDDQGARLRSAGERMPAVRVYRFGSLCTEQIKSLVYDQTGGGDTSVAIRELMDRKRRSREEE